ncbi:MAG: efflux RND transporter periplasmic adaptor subunit [Wenzhouxiangella sp.]
MKIHPNIAALCCAFLLALSGWAGLPAYAQDQSIDLEDAVAAYMVLAGALADDDVSAARAAAGQMEQALRAIDSSEDSWLDLRDPMTGALNSMARDDADIEAIRRQLQPLSTALEAAAIAARYPGPLMRAFCPMAFDFKGATWLQRDRTIANPYFGASMLRCGEIQAELGHQDHQGHQEHHDHDHGDRAQQNHNQHRADDPVDRMLGREAATQYVCPMHPQIVRDGPARCPICGMNLVLRRQDEGAAATVSIHPAIQQAMNLRTAGVERGRLERPISALGTIQVDQSSITRFTPRIEGWIGELEVTSVGESVRSGQRLFTLYSRELVNVQDEFLQALRAGNRNQIEATRMRLEVLGVQSAVIERIGERGSALTWVPWYAERSGYVAQLNVRPGSYVMPGLDLIELADASRVWLIAEVAGSQMPDLAAGQHAQAQTSSRPGQALHGRVELVYPELDSTTRTARARIVLDNANGALRVGDWASVQIDGPAREGALYIPTEALIRTGTEERVVVQDDSQRFSVRLVHAGIESGQFTEILHGLEAGEIVVVSGQFLIDSEASIRAGHKRMTAHDHH